MTPRIMLITVFVSFKTPFNITIVIHLVLLLDAKINLAGVEGFEPSQVGLKATVLPLHQTPI